MGRATPSDINFPSYGTARGVKLCAVKLRASRCGWSAHPSKAFRRAPAADAIHRLPSPPQAAAPPSRPLRRTPRVAAAALFAAQRAPPAPRRGDTRAHAPELVIVRLLLEHDAHGGLREERGQLLGQHALWPAPPEAVRGASHALLDASRRRAALRPPLDRPRRRSPHRPPRARRRASGRLRCARRRGQRREARGGQRAELAGTEQNRKACRARQSPLSLPLCAEGARA